MRPLLLQTSIARIEAFRLLATHRSIVLLAFKDFDGGAFGYLLYRERPVNSPFFPLP